MDNHYIVEIQEGCWLADWSGDPGRTLVVGSARRFSSRASAQKALDQARRYKPYLNAKIESVD